MKVALTCPMLLSRSLREKWAIREHWASVFPRNLPTWTRAYNAYCFERQISRFDVYTKFTDCGISISEIYQLKWYKGCRENRRAPHFNWPVPLCTTWFWETEIVARRRPSWLAVVPHTGCAYLGLPVIHNGVLHWQWHWQWSRPLSTQYPKVPSTLVKVVMLPWSLWL